MNIDFAAVLVVLTGLTGGIWLLDALVLAPRRARVGDLLDIAIGDVKWTVAVCGLNDQRRPASEAQLLYAETPESSARREAAKDAQKYAPNPGSDLRGRPTKKARRQIRGFNDAY